MYLEKWHGIFEACIVTETEIEPTQENCLKGEVWLSTALWVAILYLLSACLLFFCAFLSSRLLFCCQAKWPAWSITAFMVILYPLVPLLQGFYCKTLYVSSATELFLRRCWSVTFSAVLNCLWYQQSTTGITECLYSSISWAIWLQTTPLHLTYFRSTQLLSSHLRLGLESVFFPLEFPPENLHSPPIFPYVPPAPLFILLDLFTRKIFFGL